MKGSGRTPLFSVLRKVIRTAHLSNRTNIPVSELIHQFSLSRRNFLKGAGGMAASLALLPNIGCGGNSRSNRSGVRIGIVGGGMAGLNAAYTLQKRGYIADVFEASKRFGGRMYSATDLLGDGLVTELGGEFIDSIHDDMFALVSEFGLELLDTQSPTEAALTEGFYFGGQRYSVEQVIEAYKPLAERIAFDYDSLGDVSFEDEAGGTELDNTSIAAYLDRIGASGWIRTLLEVAYVTEYGLNADEQSSINLIFLISTDVSGGTFEAFGESDERYKVKGGNQRVTDELVARLEGRLEQEYILESLTHDGNEFILNFAVPNGRSIERRFDVVLLAIPFTTLRQVELALELPDYKKNAIANLGYGTNAKVLVGFEKPLWREQGFTGDTFSDEAYQLMWDNSRLQGKSAAGLTLYSGGTPGLTVGEGNVAHQVDRLLPGVERTFPGVTQFRNGKAARFHWPTHPFTLGSYACYRPGQWTTIAGSEILPVGNLYFAGEHCSYDFQGYMNGAAETGRRAGEAIADSLGEPA